MSRVLKKYRVDFKIRKGMVECHAYDVDIHLLLDNLLWPYKSEKEINNEIQAAKDVRDEKITGVYLVDEEGDKVMGADIFIRRSRVDFYHESSDPNGPPDLIMPIEDYIEIFEEWKKFLAQNRLLKK